VRLPICLLVFGDGPLDLDLLILDSIADVVEGDVKNVLCAVAIVSFPSSSCQWLANFPPWIVAY
jgi:hypothetical protein